MPVVPTFSARTDIAGPPRTALLDPNVAASGGAAMANFGEKIASSAGDIYQQEKKARQAIDYGKVQTTAMRRLAELQDSFAQDQDYRTMRQRYQQNAKLIEQEIQQGVDPEVWKRFQPDFAQMSLARELDVQKMARAGEQDEALATLQTSLGEASTQYGMARNQLEREAILKTVRENILRNVESGWIDRVKGVQLTQGWMSDADSVAAQQAISSNPSAAMQQLRKGEFTGLTAQERQRLIEKAESEQKQRAAQARANTAQAVQIIRSTKDRITAGYALPAEEAKLIDQVVGAAGSEARAMWEQTKAQSEVLQQMRKMDATQLAETIQRISIAANTDGATEAEKDMLEAATKMQGAMNTALANDPMTWAISSGVIANPTPIMDSLVAGDVQSVVTAFSARGAESSKVAEYYQIEPKPLTGPEVTAIAKAINSAPPDQAVQIVAAIQQGLGKELAPIAFEQINKQDPTLASIAGLAGQSTVTADIAATAIRGRKAMADQPQIAPTSLKAAQSATALSPAFALSGGYNSTVEVARAIYTQKMIETGETAPTGLNTTVWEQSLSMALGGDGTAGTGYGEVNGAPTVLPVGVNQREMQKAINNLTPSDLPRLSINQAPPRTSDGAMITDESIDVVREATFRVTAPGHYMVIIPDGALIAMRGDQPEYFQLKLDAGTVKELASRRR